MSKTATQARAVDIVSEPIATDVFVPQLELVDIIEAQRNTRRTYDDAALEELAGSIRTHGMLTPIRVRPVNQGDDTCYEIAAGHRRCRAAARAGLTTVPAIVRSMTDREFLEVLTIENLQRVDVHPLDEAQGYRDLLDDGGYDVHALALKVGKSETYIYARLQLLQLAPATREAFSRGYFPLSHAIELAKISPEAQWVALGELFKLDAKKLLQASTEQEAPAAPIADANDGEYDPLEDDEFDDDESDDTPGVVRIASTSDAFGLSAHDHGQPRTPALAVLRNWLQRTVYRDLARVPWELGDADLLPRAGACDTCPKRSGHALALFPELQEGHNLCLDGNCFDAKFEANIERAVEQAATEHDGAPVARLSTQYSSTRGVLRPAEYWEVVPDTEGAARAVFVEGALEKIGTATWITTSKPKTRDLAPEGNVGMPASTHDDTKWREQEKKRVAKEKEKREALLLEREASVNALLEKVGLQAFASLEFIRAMFECVLFEVHDDALKRCIKQFAIVGDGDITRKREQIIAWAAQAHPLQLVRGFVFAALGDETTIATYGTGESPRLDRLEAVLHADTPANRVKQEKRAAATKGAKAPAGKSPTRKAATKRPVKVAKPSKKSARRRS